jgi:hypothetical protein
MHSSTIGYILLALCFVAAYFIGNDLNPKVKPKATPKDDQQKKPSDQ